MSVSRRVVRAETFVLEVLAFCGDALIAGSAAGESASASVERPRPNIRLTAVDTR
jgi:hypothetical protein